MPQRIALASSDGKVINRHFGRAEQFCIFAWQDGAFQWIETRKAQPLCNDFGHSEEALQATVALLHDCEAVFAAKIGVGAANALFAAGKRVFEAPGAIEDVLRQITEEQIL